MGRPASISKEANVDRWHHAAAAHLLLAIQVVSRDALAAHFTEESPYHHLEGHPGCVQGLISNDITLIHARQSLGDNLEGIQVASRDSFVVTYDD